MAQDKTLTPDQVRAAEKRKAAAEANERGNPDARAEAWIAALKVERHGYELRGLTDRVALVDAEIERAGGKPAPKRRTRG